jgi:hypothetical protein
MKGVATVRLSDGAICEAELHWYDRTWVSARKKSSSKGRSVSAATLPINQKYVVCVRNDDDPASLELRKLYRALDDEFAGEHGMIRVIDESGEDYLYPSDFFVHVELPAAGTIRRFSSLVMIRRRGSSHAPQLVAKHRELVALLTRSSAERR